MSSIPSKRQLQHELDVESDRRHAAEMELTLHDRALDYAANGIIISEKSESGSRIIYANQAMVQLSGYESAHLIGCDLTFIFDAALNPSELASIHDAILSNSAISVRLQYRHESNAVFWCEFSIAPIPNRESKMTHFISTWADITDEVSELQRLEAGVEERTARLQHAIDELRDEIARRQQIESTMTRQQRQLEFSNFELEQFATVASHDLLEPLRMVNSYLTLIDRRYGPSLDEAGRDFIKFAVDGSARMKLLITDLSSYALLDRDHFPFSPVRLVDAVRDAVADQELRIKESGAVVEIDELPTINGDRSQLTQLFQNLISNAIKYRGKNKPKIVISSVKTDNATIIKVCDNGLGLAKRDLERIFLVFRQVDRASRQNGSGIGLAVAKKIAVRHGGRIWVESELGRGSNFFLSFPLNNEERLNA